MALQEFQFYAELFTCMDGGAGLVGEVVVVQEVARANIGSCIDMKAGGIHGISALPDMVIGGHEYCICEVMKTRCRIGMFSRFS